MDDKDKIIKQLLENDIDIKAPQGFTDDVMKSVIAFEESKKPYFSFDGGMLFLILTLSVLSSLFVFYYYDNSFFSGILSYFYIDISGISPYLRETFLNTKSLFNSNPILFPLALGIAALLLIERLLSGFKTKLNLIIIW